MGISLSKIRSAPIINNEVSSLDLGDQNLPWQTYVCKACGIFYREEDGDPDSGIPPKTRFCDIPGDWECPVCGVSKNDFALYQEVKFKSTKSINRDNLAFKKNAGVSSLRYSDVVIVGAGKAGWQTAENIRNLDPSLSITIISACSADLYEKPLISVSIVKNIKPELLIKETGKEAAQRLNINLISFTHAVGLSPDSKIIRTTRGSFKYKNLILAFGSTPRELKNATFRDCWHVNKLESYLNFRKLINNTHSKIAIIGAGLIGCELANDLALADHQITLIDTQSSPLSNLLPEMVSNCLLNVWKNLPITFIGNTKLKCIEAKQKCKKIFLSNSAAIEVDQIVLAIGLKTKNDFLSNTSLNWDNGLAVNSLTLQTNVPDIYGVGDCISINGKTSRYIEPIIRQAEVIARQICGEKSFHYQDYSTPIQIKTSSLPIHIKGKMHQDGVWMKGEVSRFSSSDKFCYIQYLNNVPQATIHLG